MIRLFKTLIRPILDYGHIALITASNHSIQKWEILQTKFIRQTFQSPKINNCHTLKLANMPNIKDRIKHLAYKWLQKSTENNKEVKEFIDTHVRKTSRMMTPYSILNKIYIK